MCCPKCGAETDAGQKFCVKCGHVLEHSYPTNQAEDVPLESVSKITPHILSLFKSKKARIALCVTAVLVIVGVLFCVFHTSLPSHKQIQADLEEYLSMYAQLGEFSIEKLSIDNKQLDGDKQFLTIICTVNLENDCVRRCESYQLYYQRWGDNDWTVLDISPYNYNR